MPLFRIRQGLRAGEEVHLTASRILIGRSVDNNLIVPDDSIDLTHASLEARGEIWVLQPLGAPSGTWVNDETVDRPRRLSNGDVLKLGKVRIEIQDVSDTLAEPGVLKVESLAEPEPEVIESGRPRRVSPLVWILGLFAVGIILYLNRDQVLPAAAPQDNGPPTIKLIDPPPELRAAPGQEIVFISEAADALDLAGVEFWVNDILVDVQQPKFENEVKMQTLHRWSSERPGHFLLKVIAFDSQGQASDPVEIKLTVE